MESEPNSGFNWTDLLKFPVRNNSGQVIPVDIIEQYMKDVQNRADFERALVRLKEHQFAKRVSSRSLNALQKEIRKQLGQDDE